MNFIHPKGGDVLLFGTKFLHPSADTVSGENGVTIVISSEREKVEGVANKEAEPFQVKQGDFLATTEILTLIEKVVKETNPWFIKQEDDTTTRRCKYFFSEHWNGVWSSYQGLDGECYIFAPFGEEKSPLFVDFLSLRRAGFAGEFLVKKIISELAKGKIFFINTNSL